MTQLFQWLTPALDNPLTALGLLLLLAMAALLWRAAPKATQDGEGRRTFQAHFGAEKWWPGLFWPIVALWGLLAAFILFGIFHSISEFLGIAPPAGDDTTAKGDLRFLLTRMAALTAVFGAVVAFPFTVIRLRLSTEENARAKDALYNDKINAALEDLHAMRQRSVDNDPEKTIWEADVTRRNGAIDRLEALAHEKPDETPRIARTLCTYVKELSREYPPKDPPEDATPEDLRDWARSLTPARSDMERAAQTLGRLDEVAGMTPEKLQIDLSYANLQGFSLGDANFEKANLTVAQLQGANLGSAKFQGAILSDAQLQGANQWGAEFQGADLSFANLQGANLWNAQLQGADLASAQLQGAILWLAQLQGADLEDAEIDQFADLSDAHTRLAAVHSVDWRAAYIDQEQINTMFGDASVELPKGITAPDHWPNTKLGSDDFVQEWTLYKSHPTTYRPPQHPERAAFLASIKRES